MACRRAWQHPRTSHNPITTHALHYSVSCLSPPHNLCALSPFFCASQLLLQKLDNRWEKLTTVPQTESNRLAIEPPRVPTSRIALGAAVANPLSTMPHPLHSPQTMLAEMAHSTTRQVELSTRHPQLDLPPPHPRIIRKLRYDYTCLLCACWSGLGGRCYSVRVNAVDNS